MQLKFTKMHGTGNDFVVIDLISQHYKLRSRDVRKLADRHFGVGCDQVLVVEPPQSPEVDFRSTDALACRILLWQRRAVAWGSRGQAASGNVSREGEQNGQEDSKKRVRHYAGVVDSGNYPRARPDDHPGRVRAPQRHHVRSPGAGPNGELGCRPSSGRDQASSWRRDDHGDRRAHVVFRDGPP